MQFNCPRTQSWLLLNKTYIYRKCLLMKRNLKTSFWESLTWFEMFAICSLSLYGVLIPLAMRLFATPVTSVCEIRVITFICDIMGVSLEKTRLPLDSTMWCSFTYRVGQSREIYSNSVPLSPPHWPYPKRIRPPSWPRVAVASSIQNTKLFTWRTWPGAGAVPKCDWAARSQCGFKQRRADHTKYI